VKATDTIIATTTDDIQDKGSTLCGRIRFGSLFGHRLV
jgi:hypothetical protein